MRWIRPLRRIWMALAFAMGWVMSRVVLAVLFYVVVTPLALVARVAGHRFLALDRKPAGSYWISRDPSAASDYEKMY